MLKEHNLITIPTDSGPEVTLEVNWDKDQEPGKFVKVNGQSVVKMKDLYGFLLVAGDSEMQEELMPISHKEVQHIWRVHNVRIEKNLKKGAIIKIPCEIDVDKVVVEGLAGLAGMTEKSERVADIIPT